VFSSPGKTGNAKTYTAFRKSVDYFLHHSYLSKQALLDCHGAQIPSHDRLTSLWAIVDVSGQGTT
jgi:hypothetical protein